jgi:hypothetical protein
MKQETIITKHFGTAQESVISLQFELPRNPKLVALEKVAENLTRYWRALKRELGDNELLRLDFLETINFELKQSGLIDEVKKDEFAILIFNS